MQKDPMCPLPSFPQVTPNYICTVTNFLSHYEQMCIFQHANVYNYGGICFLLLHHKEGALVVSEFSEPRM